eukprot:UN31071
MVGAPLDEQRINSAKGREDRLEPTKTKIKSLKLVKRNSDEKTLAPFRRAPKKSAKRKEMWQFVAKLICYLKERQGPRVQFSSSEAQSVFFSCEDRHSDVNMHALLDNCKKWNIPALNKSLKRRKNKNGYYIKMTVLLQYLIDDLVVVCNTNVCNILKAEVSTFQLQKKSFKLLEEMLFCRLLSKKQRQNMMKQVSICLL